MHGANPGVRWSRHAHHLKPGTREGERHALLAHDSMGQRSEVVPTARRSGCYRGPVRGIRSVTSWRSAQVGLGIAAMRAWPARRWVVALVTAALVALVVGAFTALVHTGVFERMLPATWWDYPVWLASALLAGLTAATYVESGSSRTATTAPPVDRSRRTLVATAVAGLAVGCPICNKVVVFALGVSGALSYWAPLQPVLGVASVLVLLGGLLARLCGEVACPAPVS